MGLEDFKGMSSRHEYKRYNLTELDDYLEKVVERQQRRFPKHVEVEFIEASPALTKHQGKAYWKRDGAETHTFIRIKESTAKKKDEKTEMVVLHEMAHVYLYQMGFTDVTEKDTLFQWLLGRVMADPTDVFRGSSEWKDVIQPFVDEEMPSLKQ